MADAEQQKKDATVLYRATVRTKDGRSATSQVAAVFGKGDGAAGDDHFGGAILYRFKVRAADGNEYPSQAVPGARAKFIARDLKWGGDQHAHGAETTMTAKVKYDAGRPVRFVVEHDHYGTWLPYVSVPATVKNGVASAPLQTHHPLFHPGQPKPLPSEMEGLDKAHLRFKVEIGPALPQPKHPDPTPPAQVARNLKFAASNLQWGDRHNTHGGETTMTAQVVFDRGRPVRFVVEHDHAGRWEPYATVPATVADGLATAVLKIRHPAYKSGATPGDDDITHLRFRVELGAAQPQVDEPFKASQLQWGDQQHSHGAETIMQARVENDFKKPVRFVVEHHDGTAWKPHIMVPAVVRNGLATANLRVEHPSLRPDAPKGAAAAAAAKLRFKVELGDAEPQKPLPFKASQLQWGANLHAHGDETTMQARVENDFKKPVRFVVEHHDGKAWKTYATVPAVVRNGVATAPLRMEHPALRPGAPAAAPKSIAAKLRFRVELGDAKPQQFGDFKASQLQWASGKQAHGSETTMQAKVENHFGKPLRFVVEHLDGNAWKPHATVPAVVRGGIATAKLLVHHPLIKPGASPKPGTAKLPPGRLRFRVEPGFAAPQPRPPAPPPPRLAPKPPPPPPPAPAKKPEPTGPVKLNLKVKDHDGHPHDSRPFEIHLADGKVVKGTTTKDGLVQASVPRGQPARLVVQGKEGPHTIQLQLGKLDPPETPKGAQQRLSSLGYKVQVTGQLDPPTKKALAAFHHDHALPGKPELAAVAKHLDLAYQGK